MAISKNVSKTEGIIRIVFGVVLILSGYSLTGLWMPLSIIAGAFLMVTAFVGYCP
jgi:hypothetical protein